MGINGEQILRTVIQEGGKLAAEFIRSYSPSARSKKAAEIEEKTVETKTPPALKSTASPASSQGTRIDMPTREETATDLKKRLRRELYKTELDLIAGLKIAGKPCDCLEEKHTDRFHAMAEELIPEEPSNTVYQDIIRWIEVNQHKVTIAAITSGKYATEYPHMASEFKTFRKRVMGSVGTTESPGGKITLEEAKEIAAKQAAAKVEKLWTEQKSIE